MFENDKKLNIFPHQETWKLLLHILTDANFLQLCVHKVAPRLLRVSAIIAFSKIFIFLLTQVHRIK